MAGLLDFFGYNSGQLPTGGLLGGMPYMNPQQPQMPMTMRPGIGSDFVLGGPPVMPTDISGSTPRPPMAGPMPIGPQVPQTPMGGIPNPMAPTQPGFLGRLSNGLANNPTALMLAGAALMSGQGYGGALQGFAQGRQQDQKTTQQQQTQLAVFQAMKARGLSDQDAWLATLHPEAAKNIFQREYDKRTIVQKDGLTFTNDPGANTSQVTGAYPVLKDATPGTTTNAVTLPVPGQQPGAPGQPGQVMPVLQGGPKPTDVADLRDAALKTPSIKRYEEAAPIFNSMVKSFGARTRASDLDFVYGMAKIFDPDSVVREGEMVIVNKSQSLPASIVGAINRLNGGEMLQEQTRRELLDVSKTRMDQYRGQAEKDVEVYRGRAGRLKANPLDVIPQITPMSELPPPPPGPRTGALPLPNQPAVSPVQGPGWRVLRVQ